MLIKKQVESGGCRVGKASGEWLVVSGKRIHSCQLPVIRLPVNRYRIPEKIGAFDYFQTARYSSPGNRNQVTGTRYIRDPGILI